MEMHCSRCTKKCNQLYMLIKGPRGGFLALDALSGTYDSKKYIERVCRECFYRTWMKKIAVFLFVMISGTVILFPIWSVATRVLIAWWSFGLGFYCIVEYGLYRVMKDNEKK